MLWRLTLASCPSLLTSTHSSIILLLYLFKRVYCITYSVHLCIYLYITFHYSSRYAHSLHLLQLCLHTTFTFEITVEYTFVLLYCICYVYTVGLYI